MPHAKITGEQGKAGARKADRKNPELTVEGDLSNKSITEGSDLFTFLQEGTPRFNRTTKPRPQELVFSISTRQTPFSHLYSSILK